MRTLDREMDAVRNPFLKEEDALRGNFLREIVEGRAKEEAMTGMKIKLGM